MTKSNYTFNKNLKAITKYKPQILQYIKQQEFVKLEPMFNKEESAEIIRQEYDKHHLLLNQCTSGVVFCVEPHIMRDIFHKYTWYKHLFLFFPSVEYFNQMLNNYDLTDLIKLANFKPILGNTIDQLEHNIMFNCEKVDVMHNGIRVFAYQPFDKIDTKLLKNIMEIMKRMAMGIHINLNTSIVYGEKIFTNDLRSIDKQLKYQTIEVLKDVAKDKPVLCISGGPSLKKQLDFIREIQNEVYIVAVAAVLKPLRAAGISCDIYTVIDMDDIIERYFEDVDLEGVKIVAEMSTYWKVMENHPEADYIISQASADGKTYLNNLIEDLGIRIPKEFRIHGAMTVAMTSIQIANLMGSSQVIMVGQDLAYGEAISHLDGSDHSSGVQIITKPDTKEEFLLFEDYGGKKNSALPLQWVDGFMGKKVPTTQQFVAYIAYMNRFFKTTGLHPINCTEGGAKISECEQMTLKCAYHKYIAPNKVLKKQLSVGRNRVINKNDLDNGIKCIKNYVKQFRRIRKIAQEGIDQFNEKKPNYDKINECVKELMTDQYANYISQNNYPGYYLFNYLGLSHPTDRIKAAIDRRNRARLLFDTVMIGTGLFIKEYSRILKRINPS